MTTPSLPSASHVTGDSGHVSDHNEIAVALNAAVYAANNGSDFANATTVGTNLMLQPDLAVVSTVTSSATLVANNLTPVDATSGAITMTLPTPTALNQQIAVEKIDTSANVVTVTGTLRGTAGSSVTLQLPSENIVFAAESLSSWRPLSSHKTLSGLDTRYLSTIGGVTVSGTPASGQALTATSPTAAGWATPSGGGSVTKAAIDALSLGPSDVGVTTSSIGAVPATSGKVAASYGLTPTAVKTASYSAQHLDFALFNCSAGAISQAFPSLGTGGQVGFKKIDSSINALTITVPGGYTGKGAAGATVTSWTISDLDTALILTVDSTGTNIDVTHDMHSKSSIMAITAANVPRLSGTTATAAPLPYVQAKDYGVLANGKTVTDASITAGSNQLSSTSASFTTADAGKLCVVVGAGAPVATTLSTALTSGSGLTSLAVAALPAAIPAGGVYVNAGQLGTTSAALSTSGTISSIPVNALAAALPAGTVTIQSGYWQQKFTTTGASSGSTSIPVTAFGNAGTLVPNFPYPSGATITVQQEFLSVGAPPGATSVPLMGPFVGHVAGGATILSTANGAVTSIRCGYLETALASGTAITLISGANSQTFTTSAVAAVGATTISVASATPNATYLPGTIIVGVSQSQNANYSFPVGSNVTTTTPALSTTITAVSAGVATLGANASTTVAGQAEVFYATDDTTAAQAALNATSVGGRCEFPSGDMGLSAVLVTSAQIVIYGQGVTADFGVYNGGTGYAGSSLFYPSVAPYLKGTVFVQCSPNTDILQLTGSGITQSVENLGLRFAGRFANTGHGLNAMLQPQLGSPYTQGVGWLDNGPFNAKYRDIAVFGHDGNHWGMTFNNSSYCVFEGLRSFGGGGINFQQVSPVGWYGETKLDNPTGVTIVAGSLHALQMGCFSSGTSIQQTQWVAPTGWLGGPTYNVPSSWPQVIQPNNGGCQDSFHTFSTYGYATGPNYGPFQSCGVLSPYFLGGGFTGSGSGPKVSYPVGPGCWSIGTYPATGTNSPVNNVGYPYVGSGTSYQNQSGQAEMANMPVVLNPAGSAVASTTTSASASYAATSITVASASGFAAGQAIQLDTGTSSEFAIIRSVAGSILNLSKPLTATHSSGVTVTSGAAYACLYLGTSALSSSTLEQHVVAECAASIGDSARMTSLSMMIPNGYFYRIDAVNSTPQYANFQVIG